MGLQAQAGSVMRDWQPCSRLEDGQAPDHTQHTHSWRSHNHGSLTMVHTAEYPCMHTVRCITPASQAKTVVTLQTCTAGSLCSRPAASSQHAPGQVMTAQGDCEGVASH